MTRVFIRLFGTNNMKASTEIRYRISRTLVLGLVAMALVLASCDVVNPTEAIVLQEKQVTFRFEINPAGVSPGESIQVTSEESADLGPVLEADFYTKSDVLTATVTRVELERINPTSIDLSILEEAVLAVTTSSLSAKNIGSATSLPASRTASLAVSSSPDVTSYVKAPSFRGALTIVPRTVPSGSFVLRTTVSFRIEVEGV